MHRLLVPRLKLQPLLAGCGQPVPAGSGRLYRNARTYTLAGGSMHKGFITSMHGLLNRYHAQNAITAAAGVLLYLTGGLC